MSIDKSVGVVLKKIKWSESSQIVSVYSKDFGKLKLVAKGALRPKSRFFGGLELFGIIEFVFYKKEKAELYILSSSELVRTFPKISSDVKRYGMASAGMELLDGLFSGEERNLKIYNLVLKFLAGIENFDEDDLESLFWAFALKLATYLGYRPKFDFCVGCGKKIDEDFVFFSSERGGLVCKNCTQKDAFYFRLKKTSADWVNQVLRCDLSRVKKLKLADDEKKIIGNLVLDFLAYHTGRGKELKSLEFLKRIS